MVLAQILPSRYSPGFHLSGTRKDFYFSGTCPDSTFFGTRSDPTFSVLTWTLLRYSPGFYLSGTRLDSTFPVLSWILPFRNSFGFHLSGIGPDFYFSGSRHDSTFSGTRSDSTFSYTRPDPTFPVLTRTLLRYSPGFYLSGTLPNSTVPVLSRILPSSVLARILPFWYSLGFYLFRYSPGSNLPSTQYDPSPVLAWIPTFSALAWILPFSGACPDFIIFSGIMSRFLIFSGIVPGFHYPFHHYARITHLPRHRARACFDRISLVQTQNCTPFVLLDLLFSKGGFIKNS